MAESIDMARVVGMGRRLAFASVAAGTFHELNNSLQVISGLAELIGGRTDLPDAVAAKVNRMRLQIDRAATSIAALQTLAQETPDRVTSVDAGRIIEDLVALRRYSLDRAGISVEVEVTTPRPLVTADPHRLRDIILALLLNAEQAVDGQSSPEIAIGVGKDGEFVVLTIRDNGPGCQEIFASSRMPSSMQWP